jgi:hypothetical protein
MEDVAFSFRFRGDDETAKAYMHSNTPYDSYLYGYVLFRQAPDDHIRRGCFQKSVVVVSVRASLLFPYQKAVAVALYVRRSRKKIRKRILQRLSH